MFSHTLSKILYDKGLSSETKWFYVEYEITGSDEEDDWFAENGVPDDDFILQYHHDGLDGAIPAFNFLDILNKENAVLLFGNDYFDGFAYFPYPEVLHNLLDIYLSGGEQAVEDRLVEMLISKT